MRSTFVIAAFMLLYLADHGWASAEVLQLGPFKPKVALYGITLDPLVDFSADLITNADGAHAAMNAFASFDEATVPGELSAVAGKLLPLTFEASSCTFEVQNVQSVELSVVNNTGFLNVTSYVIPHGCPLIRGNVSVRLRFIPFTDKTTLFVKPIRVDASVPSEWKLVAWVAGKDPQSLIEDKVKTLVPTYGLHMPSVDHVHAAFQGASLDSKPGVIVFRLRFDAQVDQPAIMDALNKSDQIKNLSITYP